MFFLGRKLGEVQAFDTVKYDEKFSWSIFCKSKILDFGKTSSGPFFRDLRKMICREISPSYPHNQFDFLIFVWKGFQFFQIKIDLFIYLLCSQKLQT